MSEKLDALEAGLSENGSELAVWRSLMEHPGWALMEKRLDTERKMRALAVSAQSVRSVGEVFAQEYMKGEASGLGLALSMPQTEVEQLELEARKLEVLIEGERNALKAEARADERSRVPSDDGSARSPSGS